MNFKRFTQAPVKLFLLCCCFYILTGCTAKPLDLSLLPNESMVITKTSAGKVGSVGVVEFVDERPVMHGSDNAKWKGLIPGVLWLEISSDIPETYSPYSRYATKPLDRETTKACVDILQRSAIFAEVVDLHKQPKAKTDYKLNGVLYKTTVNETGYYYGSCIYAWLLRILGLPYVSFEIEYHIGFSLTDENSGKLVWHTDIKGTREDKFYTVYSVSRGRDGKHVIAWNIADILAEEFNKQAGDMQQALTSQ